MKLLKNVVFLLLFSFPAVALAQTIGANLHYMMVDNYELKGGVGIGFHANVSVSDHISIQPIINVTAYKRKIFVCQPTRPGVCAVGLIYYTRWHLNPGISLNYNFRKPEHRVRPFLGLGASYLSMQIVDYETGKLGPETFSRLILNAPVGIVVNRLGNSNFGMDFTIVPAYILRSQKQFEVNRAAGYAMPMIQFKVGAHYNLGKDKSH